MRKDIEIMYSEVFEPKEATLTIDIPNEFIGKRITVEIKSNEETKAEKLARLEKSLEGYRVNLSNFKFNRDEANDYE